MNLLFGELIRNIPVERLPGSDSCHHRANTVTDTPLHEEHFYKFITVM